MQDLELKPVVLIRANGFHAQDLECYKASYKGIAVLYIVFLMK